MSIELVPYHPDLDDKTVKWLQLDEIRKEFGFMGDVNQTSHKKWINEQKNLIFFGICELETGDHIGNLLLHEYSQDANGRYLQIYIGNPNSQGKGYGKQAMNLAIDFCKKSKICKSIYLHVFSENHRAKSLYKKLKFEELQTEIYQPKNSDSTRKQILYIKRLYE